MRLWSTWLARQQAVVRLREGEKSEVRSNECHEHVRLCVANVTLTAQERVCGGPSGHGLPARAQFVNRRDGSTNGDDAKIQPCPTLYRRFPDENVSRNDRWYKSLHVMTNPIVMVPT